jgi:cbb3-type cytochrome c oxidase subunit III
MRANKHVLLWTSLGTLLLLGWAAYDENALREWRRLQRRYAEALPPEQRADFAVQLRQIVVPALDVADRCVSCHLGMAPGEPGIAGDPVFAPHPRVPHDPSGFGCTPCHGGQGRATVKSDAHGEVAHWPEPMLPPRFAHAGCGTCHTHLAVPSLDALARGRDLVERYDCLACHAVDGRGGTLRTLGAGGMAGPDLSTAGIVGYDGGWYEHHLAARRAASGGPWAESFAAIDADDLAAIDVFLSARVGAPGLVESKATFHTLGCRGCHSIGGVGGDDGPDLTREGQKNPGLLDFSHVPGGSTLGDWLAEHFRAPAKLVPGSAMPYLGLTEEQIESLTFYMLSLRRSEFPEAFWPRDRILAERFGKREFAADGATLFGTFCAACHGAAGQGMRYPGMPAFPAIGNREFLERASDDFLRQTILHGRPGRRMPAWGEKEGGLTAGDVEAVIAHLRATAGGVAAIPDSRPRRWVRGDAAEGERLYAANCASCHGAAGEGGEGPALANRVLLAAATDTYLVETIRAGRTGTAMAAFGDPSPARRTLSDDEIDSIVAHIRSWEGDG